MNDYIVVYQEDYHATKILFQSAWLQDCLNFLLQSNNGYNNRMIMTYQDRTENTNGFYMCILTENDFMTVLNNNKGE